MAKAVDFFTNKSSTGDAVSANAYSLTKVLVASGGVITPLAALVANQLGNVQFTAWQIVTLALGILGFAAIAGAADVLARAFATWNFTPTRYVQFDDAWPVAVKQDGGEGDARAHVAAQMLTGQESQFLVVQDGKASWVGSDRLNFDLEQQAADATSSRFTAQFAEQLAKQATVAAAELIAHQAASSHARQ
jgi:hypothetical protein